MFQFEKEALHGFLKSVSFPQSRQQLIDSAVKADLPQQVIAMFQKLGDRKYGSIDEVESDIAGRKAA